MKTKLACHIQCNIAQSLHCVILHKHHVTVRSKWQKKRNLKTSQKRKIQVKVAVKGRVKNPSRRKHRSKWQSKIK